jgi:hypothetical protein
MASGISLKAITQRVVEAAPEAEFLSLPLPGFDHVLQAFPLGDRGFATNDAAILALHPQLIPILP